MYPNPVIAFLLSIVPGFGHLYLNRKLRGVLYLLAFLGCSFLLFLSLASGAEELGVLFLVGMAIVWVINGIDMLVCIASGSYKTIPGRPTSRYPYYPNGVAYPGAANPAANGEPGTGEGLDPSGYAPYDSSPGSPGGPAYSGSSSYPENGGHPPIYSAYPPPDLANERFKTILLSFIPGLGHFHLGLMQRGLAFLVTFFGLFAMIIFVSIITRESFLIFLLALPVIWLYSMFDSVQLLNRKQNGERLEDRSIFEEMEQGRESGKKSRMIAMLLSIFPGAGHLYMGLQKRGLQLMAAFLFSIYILDTLHLSLFLFLIPLIWFFSLFDALQIISKYGREPLEDAPLVNWLGSNQRWFGIGLVALGSYYLLDIVVLDTLEDYFPNQHISGWFHAYFQTVAISLLFIAGGFKLISGERRKKRTESGDQP